MRTRSGRTSHLQSQGERVVVHPQKTWPYVSGAAFLQTLSPAVSFLGERGRRLPPAYNEPIHGSYNMFSRRVPPGAVDKDIVEKPEYGTSSRIQWSRARGSKN